MNCAGGVPTVAPSQTTQSEHVHSNPSAQVSQQRSSSPSTGSLGLLQRGNFFRATRVNQRIGRQPHSVGDGMAIPPPAAAQFAVDDGSPFTSQHNRRDAIPPPIQPLSTEDERFALHALLNDAAIFQVRLCRLHQHGRVYRLNVHRIHNEIDAVILREPVGENADPNVAAIARRDLKLVVASCFATRRSPIVLYEG